MKIVTSAELARLTGANLSANLVSVHEGLKLRGATAGLIKPHRLVAYLAQVGHESGSFKYDREVWGPTALQKRYDTRTDLGNTAAVDGDGYKNRGRGPIQVTGGYNIAAYEQWCRTNIDANAPDFSSNPDLINTDPWEGLSAIWYWETHKLNVYADANRFVDITRIINGGQNGAADRQSRWDAIALRWLGYGTARAFQTEEGLKADNILGPNTRARLFQRLTEEPQIAFSTGTGSVSSSGTGFFASIAQFFNSLFGIKG